MKQAMQGVSLRPLHTKKKYESQWSTRCYCRSSKNMMNKHYPAWTWSCRSNVIYLSHVFDSLIIKRIAQRDKGWKLPLMHVCSNRWRSILSHLSITLQMQILPQIQLNIAIMYVFMTMHTISRNLYMYKNLKRYIYSYIGLCQNIKTYKKIVIEMKYKTWILIHYIFYLKWI